MSDTPTTDDESRIDHTIATQLAHSWAARQQALTKARHIRQALDRAGYTVAARAQDGATPPTEPPPDTGAAQDAGNAADGRTALRDQIRALLEHMHLHEYDPDDYDAQADAITVMVDAHVERAIRAEREFLAAMLHERALQSRTLTHRSVFGIASRLVAPDITPEEVAQAITDGNYVVCDIPEDPSAGDQ